jgi:hypothetical protein
METLPVLIYVKTYCKKNFTCDLLKETIYAQICSKIIFKWTGLQWADFP